MLYTWYTIVPIVLILLAVLLVLLFRKKNPVIIWIVALIMVIVAVTPSILSELQFGNSFVDFFYEKTILDLDPSDELSIKLDNLGNKILFNDSKEEAIQFEDFKFEQYNFVYLENLDGFYVAVISIDPDASYAENRFYQGDYERYQTLDKVVFIDMQHSMMYALREYDLIGRSIDLSSMVASNDAVAYKIYHNFSERTFGYWVTAFLYGENNSTSITLSPTLDGNAYFYGFFLNEDDDETELTDTVSNFVLSGNNIAVFETPEGVKALQMVLDFTVNENGYIDSISPDYAELSGLQNIQNVQNGYYTVMNKQLYYVNDSMELMLYGNNTPITQLTSFDDWTSEIPE